MKLPEISSKFTTPKPWQIATGAGIVAAFVFILPAITHQLAGEKKKKDTAQVSMAGKVGEPWHPPAFPTPVAARPVATPPPKPPPLAITPNPPPASPFAVQAPQSLMASRAPGKPKVDPEQEAIDAPILISSGAGQSGAPAVVAAPQARKPQQAGGSPIGDLLKPTELPGYSATTLRHPNMTVEQGRVIQCHSVTRMTSGLPGFVRATVSNDVWSADDTTVLIDRDSDIFGEIQHGLVNGQERMFVLWRQITTPRPNMVRITLNSPAGDEMGEAGVTGDIDHHLWPRIKGALILSAVEALSDGLSGALSNIGRGDGNTQQQGLNLNFSQVGSNGSNLASQMLQSTINIPDTLTVNQAAPCSVFVASDLDFSGVYQITRR